MSEFTIITFNMQYGQIWDAEDPDNAPYEIEQTIAEIKRLDADIVLLQELEKVVPSEGQIHPPPNFSVLEKGLPEYSAHFSYPVADERELPFGFGQAILSKSPLYDFESVDLPAPDLTFEFMGETTGPTNRLMLAAKTLVGGREVQLFNAHLQAFFIINYSSDDYRCQRDKVEQYLRASDLPTILGGDMNSAPGEHIVQQFCEAGYATVQNKCITWKRMPYILDHLFYSPQLEPLEHRIIPTTAADHDILWARMRFVDG